MYIKNLRMRQIRKLEELELEPGVLNTEALMLILGKKNFSDRKERVFKYLDAQEDPDIMSKKIYTITSLNNINNPYNKIKELIIPDSIIYVDDNIAGFAMPLVEKHKNFGTIINNSNVPLKTKLQYLYKLGNLINRVQKVDVVNNRFQFADLNEFNFIIDKDDNVKAIDLDSAYLGVGEPLNMAYYLLKNQYILSLADKYKTTGNGIVIPTDDTDLYCYNMIILNALSKDNIYKRDIDTYYQYLEYLELFDLPSELLESFNNIYIPKNNTNPKDVLKDIDSSLEEQLDFKVFQKEYMRM